MSEEVAVTGLGLESCLGRDLDSVWDAVRAGESGIRHAADLHAAGIPSPIAGLVDLDGASHLPPHLRRRLSRFQQLLYEACASAVVHAFGKLDLPPAAGLVVGTGGGGLADVEAHVPKYVERGWQGLDRMFLLRVLPSMGAGFVAQELHCTGPTSTVNTACAAGADALAMGLELIRSGRAEVVLAAGSEAWLTPAIVGSFVRMEVVSRFRGDDPRQASRPFDKDRDGLVPAEGAAALVLESADHAERRGASVLAYLSGAGSTCDGHSLVAPREDAAAATAAISLALKDAGVDAGAIDHVNLHGTATRLNDVIESRAVKAALGDRAYGIPMTASKSLFGHSLGACGAIEAVVTVLSMVNEFVPPTRNLVEADPECDLDYTALVGHKASIGHALSVNFGFGGQNTALVFRNAQEERR